MNILITLVFKKKKKKFNNPSKCWLGMLAQNKEKLALSLKLGPKQTEKSVLSWVGKIQNLKNILAINCILYVAQHIWLQKWDVVQLWFWLNFKPHRTTPYMWLQKWGVV